LDGGVFFELLTLNADWWCSISLLYMVAAFMR